MHSFYLNTLYTLGFKELAITQAIKWVDGPTSLQKHDAGQDLLSRNDRDVLDAYKRMNVVDVPSKRPR